MRLELSRSIESDLEAIAEFIAEDNPRRALSFIRDIKQKMFRIAEQPMLYQLRPEIGADARLAVVDHYVILFRVLGEIVRIECVVYGGRDLPHLFE